MTPGGMVNQTTFLLRLLLLISILALQAECATGSRKSKAGTADRELRTRRGNCEKTTCLGMQDPERAECSYKCISEECWAEVYSKDKIEEGEVDTERSRQFAICFRKAYKKEVDAKREQDRRDKAEAKIKAQNL